ncbi:ABC transporter permease [Anaerofilum sp. BX8]|uniref:ABC transporter permease n=1 Tax=Anaerofilum hominis TaxID=2763016 RepID=A0A923REU6_9FIRM|nr:ABC transporter permease [Anaerofilum hominis]MBC5582482.1 ABC transporter permease [Anaerofilum hominis]
MNIDWVAFIADALKMATPLVFAALAALITRQAGMFNMGVEGMILCSALGSVVFAHFGGSVWVGLLGGILIGLVTGMIIAFSSLTGKTDLYLTCIAFNLMAAGGTVFVMYLLTGDKSSTAGSLRSYQIPNIDIPLIKDIPVLGRIVSGQSLLTYLAVLSVFLVWFLLKKTRIGLRIRAVGENPSAAESVGISVPKIGYISFAFCGIFAGLSGAFLSMSWVTFFMKNMVNGRGYIGLSAQNMAGGAPVGSALASLLFGFADSLSITLKNQTTFPTEFLNMIPYLATILAIIITSVIAINKRRRIEKGTAKAAAEE